MRKPRDIDAELKALQERQKTLKTRKVIQLGELVQATGADSLDIDALAGVLIDAVQRAQDDAKAKEAWRQRGEAFFRGESLARTNGATDVAPRARSDQPGAPQGISGAASG
jgi:hypothetical protein